MSSRWIFPGLAAVVVIQVGILAGEYLNAVYPLWTGQEVKLKTVPVDPRSLFRGNYALLNYGIANVALPYSADRQKPRHGEIIYVKLKEGKDGVYLSESTSLTRPEQGLFIRGRVQSKRFRGPQVRYGIEAYFLPKEKALTLEKELRRGGIAKVMVAGNGKAALKEVIANRD